MGINNEEYNKTFKALYYNLYSNGSSSRAEKIISDVTKLLLCKLAFEKGDSSIIEDYLSGTDKFSERMLPHLRNTYPELFAHFEGFSFSEDITRHSLQTLSNIRLRKAPAHIIGDAFQTIIGSSIRGDKGQFFTPLSVVQCMVQIVQPSNDDLIIDPACGTGGFLSEAYQFLENSYNEVKARFIGIDKDKDMADLAQTMMEIVDGGKTEVYNLNSLELIFNEHSLNKLVGIADIVFTNPPFGTKIGITDENILTHYDFGHNWVYSQSDNEWYMLDSICKSQDPQILFTELCVRLLKADGKMAIVLPEGVFGNKSYGFVWDYLMKNGQVLAMIDCPRNTFQPSTDTKTNILFFQKGKPQKVSSAWIAIAKNCGHDKRGRIYNSSGEPIANDFSSIGSSYNHRHDTTLWHKASLDKQYFVPRYYIARKNITELSDMGELVTLGELIKTKSISIRSGHEVGSDAYGTGDVPFIRTSDINNLEISSDPTNSVSEEIYFRYRDQQNLADGDILFIADGRYRIGKTAILNKYNKRCIIQSHIEIISVSKTSPIHPYELLFVLNMESVQEQIRSLVFIHSTLGTLGSRIKEIEIPIPNRTIEWYDKIESFKKSLETRAELLSKVKVFEHSFDL